MTNMRFKKLIVIHTTRKDGSVVFPAKIYIFGRRAVCNNRWKELNR